MLPVCLDSQNTLEREALVGMGGSRGLACDQLIAQSINHLCNRLWSRHVISDTKAFSFLFPCALVRESRWMDVVCLSNLDSYARTNEHTNQ